MQSRSKSTAPDRGPGVAVLALASVEPIAAGNHRLVFDHPHDAGALIKVARPDRPKEPSAVKRYFSERSTWRHPYIPYVREITEQLALRARAPADQRFFARVLGFVDTDLGLGLVVEKLARGDGKLAPDLASLLKTGGMTPELRAQVGAFCEALLRCELVVSDLHPHNIVLASDAHGERLVLVDGIGEKVLIPIHRLSRIAKRRYLKRNIGRLLKKVIELGQRRGSARGA